MRQPELNLIEPANGRRASGEEMTALVRAYRRLRRTPATGNGGEPPTTHTAIPLGWFQEHDVSEALLAWMIYQDHLEHWQPASPNGDRSGSLSRLDSVHFTAESYFTPTPAGVAAASWFGSARALGALRRSIILADRLVPRYDQDERTLYWGAHVLKRFKKLAANEELLLCAAQEQQWPLRPMDDPLPRLRGKKPEKRLHNTTQDLKRRLLRHFVGFYGDGTGTRFGWRLR